MMAGLARAAVKPIAASVVLAIIGAWAVRVQVPWLVPSLGSAVVAQTLDAPQPTSRPWSIGGGQVMGLAGGFAGVYLLGAGSTPIFMGDHRLTFARIGAAAIAVLIAGALQLAFQAKSPAGGATALIVALGQETANWSGAGRLITGILLVTVLGEIARRIVLRMTG